MLLHCLNILLSCSIITYLLSDVIRVTRLVHGGRSGVSPSINYRPCVPGFVTFGPQCSLCLNNAAAVLITRTPIQRTVNTVQPCTLEVSEPGALCSPVVFGSRLSKLE